MSTMFLPFLPARGRHRRPTPRRRRIPSVSALAQNFTAMLLGQPKRR